MNKKGLLLAIVVLINLFGCLDGAKEKSDIKHLSIEESIKINYAQICIVPSFPGELKEWTPPNVERTYNTIKKAGIQISHISYMWGEIESKEGRYNWDELDFHLKTFKEYNIKVSLLINIIDTNKIGQLPKDVIFTDFNSPLFKERFKTFILKVLERYGGKIDYLWIGNEIDEYFSKHRDQLDSYIRLYNETYIAVKTKYPNVKVGTISAYQNAKNYQALDIIEMAGRFGSIIGFTLYPQMIENTSQRDVEKVFSEMSVIASRVNKKFAITETGWSSAGFEGSETKQTQYIQDLFKSYLKYNEKIEFLGLFLLYDFPETVNKSFAASYGIDGHKEYLKFQGSLGLAHNDGRAKEGWRVLLEEIKKVDKAIRDK